MCIYIYMCVLKNIKPVTHRSWPCCQGALRNAGPNIVFVATATGASAHKKLALRCKRDWIRIATRVCIYIYKCTYIVDIFLSLYVSIYMYIHACIYIYTHIHTLYNIDMCMHVCAR